MLKKRDFISIGDLSISEIRHLLQQMWDIKKERELAYSPQSKKTPFYADSLKGIRPYSLFNYPSIRTISSYSVALSEMNACPDRHFTQEDLPRIYSQEKISHIAKVLSGHQLPWFHLGYVRFHGLGGDRFVRELAKHSTIPIINAMTKTYHPLQGLTDIFTVLEEWKYFKGQPIDGKQITWFGMGNNNITHSLMLVASAVGIDFLLLCPEDKNFLPDSEVLRQANAFADESGSKITINNVAKIVDTDAIFADTHALGETEAEKQHSQAILAPYRLEEKTVQKFKNPDWIFLHCMPIHVNQEQTDYEEVSREIVEGPNSRIFQEAENRLYAIMAVLYSLTQP